MVIYRRTKTSSFLLIGNAAVYQENVKLTALVLRQEELGIGLIIIIILLQFHSQKTPNFLCPQVVSLPY